VRLTVNRRTVTVTADPDTPLLTVLRNELGLVGARFGCGQGFCGACFVQVNGTVVSSCDTPLWSVENADIVTVEGLAPGLHPVQQAILDEQAAQCAFCVSGIAVNAAALLDANPHPDEADIVKALDRNMCRCGVHRRIVNAVLRAGQ
jgi:nicotinate dehydrogenase subunit A